MEGWISDCLIDFDYLSAKTDRKVFHSDTQIEHNRKKSKYKRYTDNVSEGGLGGDGRNVDNYEVVEKSGRRRQPRSKHRPATSQNYDSKHRIHGKTRR